MAMHFSWELKKKKKILAWIKIIQVGFFFLILLFSHRAFLSVTLIWSSSLIKTPSSSLFHCRRPDSSLTLSPPKLDVIDPPVDPSRRSTSDPHRRCAVVWLNSRHCLGSLASVCCCGGSSGFRGGGSIGFVGRSVCSWWWLGWVLWWWVWVLPGGSGGRGFGWFFFSLLWAVVVVVVVVVVCVAVMVVCSGYIILL